MLRKPYYYYYYYYYTPHLRPAVDKRGSKRASSRLGCKVENHTRFRQGKGGALVYKKVPLLLPAGEKEREEGSGERERDPL